MKINIAISAYNRPEYTQRSLAAIFGAKGFSKDRYKIFAAMDRIDSGSFNMDVLNVLQDFGINPYIVPSKYGCNYTIKAALELAWEDNPDFVLMIEDDIIISDDALMYIEWAAEKYRDDHSVRTVGLWGHNNGYSLGNPLTEGEHGRVMRQNYFTCWGWGTWKDRWEEMFATWTTGDDSHNTSWDVIVSSHLGNRVEILPSISRAYNCGEHGGTHRGRAWPGIVASGLIDPDGQIEYWEYNIPKLDEEQLIYVILGRFGDIYMVAKKLKKPSTIACLEEFSGILDELFPEHTCIKLKDLPRNNPILASQILSMSHPFHTIIICQQDGTPLENMKEFRTFQTYQEYYAVIQ
jgi:hypothetical protein